MCVSSQVIATDDTSNPNTTVGLVGGGLRGGGREIKGYQSPKPGNPFKKVDTCTVQVRMIDTYYKPVVPWFKLTFRGWGSHGVYQR